LIGRFKWTQKQKPGGFLPSIMQTFMPTGMALMLADAITCAPEYKIPFAFGA
jgi:hypothetical protein